MPTLKVLITRGGVDVGRIVRNLGMIQGVVAMVTFYWRAVMRRGSASQNVSALSRGPISRARLATPESAALLCPEPADTAVPAIREPAVPVHVTIVIARRGSAIDPALNGTTLVWCQGLEWRPILRNSRATTGVQAKRVDRRDSVRDIPLRPCAPR